MHKNIQMELSFLPKNYLSSIENIDINLLYEIRLRTSYPVKVNYANQNYYLCLDGLTKDNKNLIICQQYDIDYVIDKITEHSLYAFNDRIKDGYITTSNGIRVGVAGECVFDNNKILTIKNFSSLNIRIPHTIIGCSKKFMPHICRDKNINSTIIVSPPFLGKTTLLKDIVVNLNKLDVGAILVIDERGEFSLIKGENVDNISYSNKNYAFNYAIRSMSPKIVITDELSTASDWQCAKNAISSGVKIIASCHSDGVENLMKKPYYINNIFDRYIFLENNNSFGQVKCVLDKDFNKLCDYV